MGILNKIFGKDTDSTISDGSNKSFVDCVQIVNAWKTRATIDPDIVSPNDTALRSALNSHVSCPYCSSEINFKDAVINSGVSMRIRCPVCQTEPVVRHNI